MVIGAIVPAVLLSGFAQPIGQRPLAPTIDTPPPVILVQSPPVPAPGAFVWAPRPFDAGVVAPPDRLSPTQVQVNQPAVPGAIALATYAPRDANTDPLRPPIVVSDPPDSTLAQPAALWAGRLSRPEDPNWPARPAVVAIGSQPIPSASAVATYAPRDTSVAPQVRLAPPIVVADPPDATLQQPSTAWLGRLPRDEDTSRPARPALIQTGAQPTPGALALLVGVAHDVPVIPTDRLSITQVIPGQQPKPIGAALAIGAIKAPANKLPPPLAARVGFQPLPSAAVYITGRGFEPGPIGPIPTPADRIFVVAYDNRIATVEALERVSSILQSPRIAVVELAGR